MSDLHSSLEAATFSVKLVHMVAGVAGGIVRALVLGRYGMIEATSAVIAGGLTAGYGTPAATSILYNWLSDMGYYAKGLDGAVGFMLGLCGMTIAEIVIQRLKLKKNSI